MHRQFQRQGQPPRTWTSLCKPSGWTVRRTPRRISTWIMTSKMAQAQMIRAPSPAIGGRNGRAPSPSPSSVASSGGPMATRTTVLSARQLEAHRRATAGPARSHSPASKLREQVRRSARRPRAPRPVLLSHVPRFPRAASRRRASAARSGPASAFSVIRTERTNDERPVIFQIRPLKFPPNN